MVNRRLFLETMAAAAVAPSFPSIKAATKSRVALPPIPRVGDLASADITHDYRDLYSVATLQNELGYAQVAKSVSGLSAIAFPPYACCGVPDTPWSPGFLLTCEIFLNGNLLIAYGGSASQVTCTWYPHRVVRRCQAEGLHFVTETCMPSKQRSVAQRIEVRNLGHGRRKIQLGFDLRAGVVYKRGASAFFPNSPGEADNQITWLPAKGCLVFEARHSKACSVQGFNPRPDRLEAGRMLIFDVDLGPGESKQFRYFNAIAENGDSALGHFEEALTKFDELFQQNERDSNNLIEAAFTPGNTEFSGHLPQLFTRDESLWRLYYGGFSSLLFARRASPDSAYGTTYVTLGGRVLPTVSAPWDTSLTSLSLSLLDPAALRRLVEAWFEGDIMHQHLCTDHVTGDGVGYWYAVNDMALVRCARDYLRVTGDIEWLDNKVNGGTVFDRLLGHALYWKKLDHRGAGLADYGKIENLLEVVSTYVHEVAGMNAGNVSSMRFMAEIAEGRGNIALASQLRTEAKGLAGRINRLLYVNGKGWWRCGQPDGSFNEVRHCYDMLSVFDNMFEDLSDRQKQEMSHFFWSELYTPLWMRALSAQDPDATWNIRPDHSCIGSYPGWPPMMAKGLYKTDNSSRVAKWVKGLAKATLQGPYGQAHFVEDFFPPEHGGACKCPSDPPYLTDWSEVCGGCFTDLVIDTIFGAEFTLYQGMKTTPRLDDFDPAAQLVNVNYQGKGHILSKNR